MGKISSLVLVGAMLFASEVPALEVRGARSCGQWVQTHNGPLDMSMVATEAWLLGYLSGKAAESRLDFIVGTDNESIMLWMNNYCHANPLKHIDDGADILAIELAIQKGLRAPARK